MKCALAGARGKVGDPETVLRKAQAWASKTGAEIVLARAESVFGPVHLESAARHAFRAHEQRTAIGRTLAAETLRYLAGRRQVADAIEAAGIRPETDRIALVLFESEHVDELLAHLGWTRDDAVLEATGKPLAGLGITKAEEATVPDDRRTDLVLERVALLDILK